jgi:hypothetical protein
MFKVTRSKIIFFDVPESENKDAENKDAENKDASFETSLRIYQFKQPKI